MRTKGEKYGAVAVIGAGIGGMQASLDLANAGFKVYLVEKSNAIGGVMAKLDKTFPTNDCSMCIISPKLVEVGRHPDISLMTHSQVTNLSGDVGRFTMGVHTRAKFVDPLKCTGCGECANHCPVILPNEFDENLSERKAISKLFPQAIPNAFSIDKRGVAPCKVMCPAHISVQGYVALTAEGKFKEALELIKKDNPLPAVCGRVCHHPCETDCTRGEYDQPVSIKAIKRFLADLEPEMNLEPPEPEKEYGDKVAIVGSGPGGLSAAYYLAINGYKPTVFESGPQVGGMLRTGIPPYRLPRDVLDAEIDYIKRAGVTIKTNTAVDKDNNFDKLKREGFKAFFIATGAHKEWGLNVPGNDLDGVLSGYGFLREKNLGGSPALGKKVVVVGGGNVAMDAARVALRMDAEVTILYRRSRDEMPALPEEIKEAEDEKVAFNFLCAPVEIVGNGKVEKVRCQKMELGEPDASGRRRPVPIENSEFDIECDNIISAIGQFPDLDFLTDDEKHRMEKKGKVEIDPVTFSTAIPGIFSGGDSVLGPATVIEAIAAGKGAAESIHRFCQGMDLRKGREAPMKTAEVPPLKVKEESRLKEVHMDPEKRVQDFSEVCRPFAKDDVIAEAERCLSCGICSECYLCVDACQADAVIHNDQPVEGKINVGSIILAPGFEPFDPNIRGEFGYDQYPNVVTSLEFERILSASGPYQGHVHRPSDGKEPKRIAWIQCVGSRDENCGNGYCSSVCCMYATKEAVIAAEHLGEIDATIFYMDLRAFGKGFDDYINRAKASGVKFVNSMVSRVIEDPITNDLELGHITPSGEKISEIFDMVVLSIGMQISPEIILLADRLGVEVSESGFAKTSSLDPLATSVPGIFVAGAFAGPKDIPETVAEASAAAACAGGELSEVRGLETAVIEKPMEKDVTGKEIRTGVFVCHCGINIGSIVDVPGVAKYAKTLPNVVHVEDNLYTCSQDTQEKIKELIKEHDLNRIVIASCSPRTHEPLFQETFVEAGLNPFLFDMANIRDQCSWVNRADKERATLKSKDLVRMATNNVAFCKPLYSITVDVNPNCLIIGGGLAGMTAALETSKQGFESVLVERSDRLGGYLWNLRKTYDDHDVKRLVESLIKKVRSDPKITVRLNSLIVDFTGYVGNYETEILTGATTTQKIKHGAIILATGGGELATDQYLMGQNEKVITQTAFERRLSDEPEMTGKNNVVAMIQCVGSREGERSYCSRVCCNQALKNALHMKKLNPDSLIAIIYRDIRSYGEYEKMYAEARKKGVLFIQYDPEKQKPEVTDDGGLSVVVMDEILGNKVRIRPDLLVLSVATVAGDNEEIGSLLKLARNDHGFFIEAHQKLRPVDFASDGLFLAGLAHGPKSIPETISQAQAAVARAGTLLAHKQKHISGIVSRVDSEKCAVCLTCVRACPYDIPIISQTESTAVIDATMCHGCGICAADCPGKAIELAHFEDSQIMAKSKGLYERSAK